MDSFNHNNSCMVFVKTKAKDALDLHLQHFNFFLILYCGRGGKPPSHSPPPLSRYTLPRMSVTHAVKDDHHLGPIAWGSLGSWVL